MRKFLTITLILFVSCGGNASRMDEYEFDIGSKIVQTTVYLNGSQDDIYVMGKMISRASVSLYISNFRASEPIYFDPTEDNLFIKRFGNMIRSTYHDYEYISPEINPNGRILVHFYLPRFKGVTNQEILYLTYNSTQDTMIIVTTENPRIRQYVRKSDRDRRWSAVWYSFKKGLLGIAAYGAYKVL